MSTGKKKVKRETQNLAKGICTCMHDRSKCLKIIVVVMCMYTDQYQGDP